MPSDLSNLLPGVSASFLKIARYGPPPAYAVRHLRVPQQTEANIREIGSLAPRVKALAESLCAPGSEDDIKERLRRRDLERYIHAFQRRKLSLTSGDC